MVSLLISLLVLLIVVYVAHLIVEQLGFPDNIKKVIYIILGLIFLLVLLGQLGLIGNAYVIR
jgi:hypothetical protein